jgi:uncharacterized membrane protein
MQLASDIVFAIGSLICHQRPERSFFLAGHQLPVCARCTGIYLSAVAGVIGWVVLKTSTGWRRRAIDPGAARAVLIAAAAPTALSVASGVIGLWDGSNITRALMAVPLGVTAGVIVAAVAAKDLR